MNSPALSNKLRALTAGVVGLGLILLLVLSVTSRQKAPTKDMLVGTTTLDENGEATITLSSSITQHDSNLSYQVDSMGAPMPGLYIKSQFKDGSFAIGGGTPGGEVAWQLVGDRTLTK
jgi:hypothetical protein